MIPFDNGTKDCQHQKTRSGNDGRIHRHSIVVWLCHETCGGTRKVKNLIIPKKLNAGDKVAFISISGGRAGDKDMVPRYMLGKRRLKFSNREYYNISEFQTIGDYLLRFR